MMSSFPSAGVVIVNLVRQSVLDLLEVLPDACTPATVDAFRKFLTGVSPFEPRTVQETLRERKNRKRSQQEWHEKKTGTYEIFLRTVFSSKPYPLIDSRPQVVVMLLEEARGPVGVASTREWVIVPPMEEDGGGFGNVGHIRVHGVENIHQFCLDFSIRQRFNAFRPVAL